MTGLGTISVLVTDDHEITRRGLVLTLQLSAELNVVGEAVNGRDAVEKSMTLLPDVVLMDISMPIMDGFEATKEIKSKLPKTRIIMLTSNESDDDVFSSLAAGAAGYCLKSIAAAQLSTAVIAVHSGAAYLDPGIAARVLRSYQVAVNLRQVTDKNEFSLSERELEVLSLLVDGLNNQCIGERLFITIDTVKSHMRHILEKLAVADRTQAAVKAIKQGLV